MLISSEDLPRHLVSGLKPLYVVTGDALLLSIEAADNIRAAARAAGFEERDTLTAESNFKWSELRNSVADLSLFSPRKVIDLRIPTGKPGVEGGNALQEHCKQLNDDILTLITLPKLDRTTQKSAWYGTLEKHGIIVSADDVPRPALPRWIAGRLKRQQQSTDNATLEFIADKCEGNLFAAFQEIQKLALLFPAGELSFEQVKDAVLDVARYDIFKLSEAMLSGNVARYARILDGLRQDGTAIVLVLWAITEEIRALARVLQLMQNGTPLSNALREARVWGSRQGLVEQAVRRIKLSQAERGLQQAALVDKTIKGLRQGDVWDELLQLGLRFAKA